MAAVGGKVLSKRWMRWVVAPISVVALALLYQLTRPPELEWWTSPPIGRTGLHLRMLIPNGWEVEPGWRDGRKLSAAPINSYAISASEREPSIVRWILRTRKDGVLGVSIPETQLDTNPWGEEMMSVTDMRYCFRASRVAAFKNWRIAVQMDYYRNDRKTFNRTYKRICDSLKIE